MTGLVEVDVSALDEPGDVQEHTPGSPPHPVPVPVVSAGEFCPTCREPSRDGVCVMRAMTQIGHGHKAPEEFVDLVRAGLGGLAEGPVTFRILTGDRDAEYFSDE